VNRPNRPNLIRRCLLILGLLCAICNGLSIQEVTAISAQGLSSALNRSELYSPSVCSGTTPVSFGSGSLPSSVPAPYNGIFTAAANKFDIAPAFLAAIFYGGEHGGSWPTPPPPYGSGAPWASSGVSGGGPDWPTDPPGPGAAGPFQFEYSTWLSNRVSANGQPASSANPEDLADAAFSAANLLANLGAKGKTDEATLTLVAANYNGGPGDTDVTGSYATDVWNAFEMFSGASPSPSPTPSPTPTPSPSPTPSTCGPTTTTSTGFENPFRSVSGLTPERIDEGVDYSGTGSVYAVGSGTVTSVFTPSHPGIWWTKDGGNSVVYQLDPGDGPAGNKYIYIAEDCTPNSLLTPGSPVTSGTVICTMYDGGDGIETGWALGNGTDEPAAGTQGYNSPPADPVYPDGTAMAYGRNFSAFLQSIPSTPGGVLASSTNPSVVGGSLPSGWPTW